MIGLDLDPNKRSDEGLLEILAANSLGKGFYHSYRYLVLVSLRPDILATDMPKWSDAYVVPDVSNELAVREALSGRLKETLKAASNDICIPRYTSLEIINSSQIAQYCQILWDRSQEEWGDLSDSDAVMGKLENPLADPTFIEDLWPGLWYLTRKAKLPSLDRLMVFGGSEQG